MKWSCQTLLLLALLSLGSLPALGQARSQLALHLDHRIAPPGTAVRAGISIRLPAGWHTYWRNPGESGLAATLRWTLPEGVEAGSPEWPVPTRHVDGAGDFTLTTFVLEGEPVIAVPIRILPGATPGPKTLQVRVDWQECDTSCVRGTTNLTATIDIGSTAEMQVDERLTGGWQALPTAVDPDNPPQLTWLDHGQELERKMEIRWNPPSGTAEVDFFPHGTRGGPSPGYAPGRSHVDGSGASLMLVWARDDKETGWPDQVGGLLVARDSGGAVLQAVESATLVVGIATGGDSTTPAQGSSRVPFSWISLATMLGFAFLGGIILNIMPCVLPVLALKVLGFVRQAGSEPAKVRRLAWMYGAGVLTSFLALAGVALAIQAGGGVASWGSAFQNPPFRIAMTVLMVAVALNLFGVYEVSLGGGTASRADALTRREGPAGAFFHGLLAAVLATPCMAPFLATALAFAFTQPPAVVVLVFLTVGAGLAAPFVLLCLRPAWLKLLPKPGIWMVRFKVAMGFPMLATAVWIFWFTAKRLGNEGVLWLGLTLVIFAAAAWIWGEFVQKGARPRWLAVGTSVVFVLVGYFGILEHQLDWRGVHAGERREIAWQKWSRAAVAQAQADGHPVLVDFTADNCVNCKLNKLRSIDIPETMQLLDSHGFVPLIGDFTDADPAIADELKRFDRYGVPLVLVYPAKPGAEPRVMPPLFGPDALHEALEWALRSGPAKPSTAGAGADAR